MQQKYINESLSIFDIGKESGVSGGIICRWLRKFGIPLRKSNGYHPNKCRFGEENHKWNGRKAISRGYVKVVVDFNHPTKDLHGYVMEHKLVVESKIGRFLNKNEMVHHVNAIKSDNRIENLMVFPSAKMHTEYHKFFENLCLFLLEFIKEKPTYDFAGVLVFDPQIEKIVNGKSLQEAKSWPV